MPELFAAIQRLIQSLDPHASLNVFHHHLEMLGRLLERLPEHPRV